MMEFIDLAAQQNRIKPAIDAAIARVLKHGQYIMGPEVAELEKQLAAFCGARYCVSCSSGTDALALALMAKGVEPGAAVFVPTFTFAASAEVVALLGAVPFFVDVLPDTFTLDPHSLTQAIAAARRQGLKPAAVMPVDLFGQPADYDRILPIAAAEDLWVLCDAAQSFGGAYRGRKVGNLGLATATSFFPAKPLGCYGDGGAVFTDDKALFDIMASLRVHGKGSDKYDNVRVGMNARLDTLQAAILLEKLKIFPEELAARDRIAQRYTASLSAAIATPAVLSGVRSAWAQYTLLAPSPARRDALQAALKKDGVPTVVYYPRPLHLQTAYRHCPTATGGALPVAEDLASRVFSLPMHPYLDEAAIDHVADSLHAALHSPAKHSAA